RACAATSPPSTPSWLARTPSWRPSTRSSPPAAAAARRRGPPLLRSRRLNRRRRRPRQDRATNRRPPRQSPDPAMRLRKEHVIASDAEELWRRLFDPAFDREHAVVANRMRAHEILSCKPTGELWELRTRSTPSTPVPRFVVKWIGAELSFDTTLTRRCGASSGTGVLKASVMPERIHLGFRIEIVPEEPGRCRRVMDWEIRIDGAPPLIQPLVERFIARELGQSLDASARFIDGYG